MENVINVLEFEKVLLSAPQPAPDASMPPAISMGYCWFTGGTWAPPQEYARLLLGVQKYTFDDYGYANIKIEKQLCRFPPDGENGVMQEFALWLEDDAPPKTPPRYTLHLKDGRMLAGGSAYPAALPAVTRSFALLQNAALEYRIGIADLYEDMEPETFWHFSLFAPCSIAEICAAIKIQAAGEDVYELWAALLHTNGSTCSVSGLKVKSQAKILQASFLGCEFEVENKADDVYSAYIFWRSMDDPAIPFFDEDDL